MNLGIRISTKRGILHVCSNKPRTHMLSVHSTTIAYSSSTLKALHVQSISMYDLASIEQHHFHLGYPFRVSISISICLCHWLYSVRSHSNTNHQYELPCFIELIELHKFDTIKVVKMDSQNIGVIRVGDVFISNHRAFQPHPSHRLHIGDSWWKIHLQRSRCQ